MTANEIIFWWLFVVTMIGLSVLGTSFAHDGQIKKLRERIEELERK